MWVFCGGMFRSASTLQFQIAARLVKESQVGRQIGWIDANRFTEIRQSYADECGLKVVKVHNCTEPIQAEFLQDQALGLYISRDVRDVFSSYLKQRQKPFEFLWNQGFLETCLNNYQIWTTLPHMYISTYEDMINNAPKEVYRIAQHLHLNVSWTECQKIADDYSLESQERRIQSFQKQLLQTPSHPQDQREMVDHYHEETLLHINHIDSAKSGRWQDDLSPQEVVLIEQKVEDWCIQNNYAPTVFLHSTLYSSDNRLVAS